MKSSYYKCKQCKAILESCFQDDELECLNCSSTDLELTDNFLHETLSKGWCLSWWCGSGGCASWWCWMGKGLLKGEG